MPTWQRRRTGSTTTPGFWTGTTTDTFTDNCDAGQKAAIEAAFNNLNGNPGLNCFPALRDAMRSEWPTIPINCCFDNSRPKDGELTALIFVCNMTDRQIQVELCQGLVRASGGTVLDVKAMQMSCFGAPEGIPTGAQFNEMTGLPQMPTSSNERVGEFTIWNRTTGEVWDKTTAQQAGFWTATTVPAKGGRCFINSGWVF